MTATRPVVWAVVRDLGRTGVPIALARLATWPATSEAVDLHLIARHDGPLRTELERAGIGVTALEPADGRSRAATVAAGASHLGRTDAGAAVLGAAWRRRIRNLPAPDTVLVQGAGAWPVAEALRAEAAPRIVVHLHELEVAVRRSIGPSSLPSLAAADQVLAVSEPVASLARSLGVPDDRLSIVGGTVDLVSSAARGRTDVVSVGEAGWRKGTDRAVAAAHVLRRREPTLRWHWIGRALEPGWAFAVDAPLPILHHAPVADPWSVVHEPAALVVPSREDPLPLVALEAAARSVPVIACRGAGGLDGLLAEGRGWLVDPTDPGDLAATVAEVVAARPTAGPEALRDHVERHHTLEAVGPRWLHALTGGT
ncbi:MAG TPA: glycosyltransferase family 4 protein [Acidimicrobiales bacterium]|nr:glycosyltransferase family 4 protein [Acidimicrobiales bacterium]